MQNHFSAPSVPWSVCLPEFFRTRNGYGIEDKLHLLFFDVDDCRKVRYDFYSAATDLFKESFSKQYYDWCEKNGLLLTGHFMAEDSMLTQTQWSGDTMAHYEFMHWPGIDKLGRNLHEIVTCKQVSSAVDQLGKERSFCEVFGCVGGQVSFFHRKWIADWQASLGISFINHHLSLYSMRGERKRDFPANLFYQQPWWEDEREFSDYQARLCAAVSEGTREVDILLLQPLSTVWAEYSPLHGEGGYAIENSYDWSFAQMSRALMASKLDFHYGNDTLMAGHAAVEGGKLRVGKHAYSSIVVPLSSNLAASTLALLKDAADGGCTVIFVGGVPGLVDGSPAEVNVPGAIVKSSIHEMVEALSELFPNRIKVTDKLSGQNSGTVYVHCRKMDGSLRYLLVNTDAAREVHATVEIPGAGPLAAFDLFDGSSYKLTAPGGRFDVTLAPAGSLLIISGDEAKEAGGNLPFVLGSGAAFGELPRELPVAYVERFDCEVVEENVLVLNDFALEMDGKLAYEGPVCGAWHTHFYPAADGTPFKATYTFHSECEVDRCFAAIEVAENLDRITLNGEELRPLKSRGELGPLDTEKSWKDINFTKVPLPKLQIGANTLVIEGQKVSNITGPGFHVAVEDSSKHLPTEAEEIYICGNFSVKKSAEGRLFISHWTRPTGRNLTREGFPFYSGRIRLSSRFGLPDEGHGRVMLALNNAFAASVTVRLNGTECGTLRWPPYMIDVTDAASTGENRLEVEIATTLVNAFGPNRTSKVKDVLWLAPQSFITMSEITESYQLFDFGLESASVFVVPDSVG
jgi:hypothetical protein